eukprot:474558-Pyramimonas_sp.AAC.1
MLDWRYARDIRHRPLRACSRMWSWNGARWSHISNNISATLTVGRGWLAMVVVSGIVRLVRFKLSRAPR